MGVWGDALYSGDFAMDLRSTIGAVTRLPFDGDRLLQILCGIEPGAANDQKDTDHSIFRLVVADQFAKRGILSKRVQETALAIIDRGTDLEIQKSLGMQEAGLARRQEMLLELRARVARSAAKPSTTLKRPQPLLMNPGDVLVYPTSEGDCINSYFLSKERIPNWKHDGWGAAIIFDRGRAFQFLAWYRPITLTSAVAQKPTIEALFSLKPWISRRPGTCSAIHYKRMELEKIGTARIKHERLRELLGEMKPGTYQAINDISIVNELGVGPRSLNWLQLEARDPMPAGRRTECVTLSELSAIVDEFKSV